MNTKEAYKMKMEAELELAQAKLAEFKAQAKSAAADTQIKQAKEVDELEEKVGDTKARLHEHELAEPSDDVWEKFQGRCGEFLGERRYPKHPRQIRRIGRGIEKQKSV